ncbi:MAG TPA: hypothetical protein VD788_15345 [Candidatus Polarisedimenticolaceae bacterium]|nr:hypothetical protein [Candidatus Polarisedimenticolaceae bacterium]
MDRSRVPGSRPVVILNMHYSGLGIARDLAGTGAAVHGLSFDPSFFGNYSKHCRFVVSPDTETQPEQCLDFLLDLASRCEQRPLLLVTRDHDIDFFLRFRSELDRVFVVPYPSSETLSLIMDKNRLFARARELGIRCPRECVVRSKEELVHNRERLVFPCIVKPVRASQWRQRAMWRIVRRKVVKIDSYAELEAFYRTIEPHDPLVQIEEYIPGPDSDLVIFGSYRNPATGVLACFTARKLIQYPSGSGTGVAVQSRRITEIEGPSKKLLDGLGYFGISEIEYKRDGRDGSYALIEMNPRHWDQHSLGAASGVNLSRALYRDLLGEPPGEAVQADREVVWLAEEGYFRSLLSNLRGGLYPWSLYAAALRGRKVFAVFDRHDLKPIVHLLRTTARQTIRQAFAKS